MEKSFFFNATVTDGVADRTYSAEDIAQREACLISDGVIGGKSLSVMGSSSDTVLVTTGAAIIRGYTYLTTSGVFMTVSAGDSTYDRIDTVALRLDLNARTIKAVLIEGTPASSPAAAELKDTSTVKEIPLADILVERGSVPVVEDSHIRDRRVLAGYASLKDDLVTVIREYLGELEPVNSAEAAKLRTLLQKIGYDRGADAVLCGDGEYREFPVTVREMVADYTLPGTFEFAVADFPSEGGIYDIEVQGAGGAGGAYNGIANRGGGGGGGAFVRVSGVELAQDYYKVTVGQGGIGVPGQTGNNGGDSAFGGFVAEGGRGGEGGVSHAGGTGGIGLCRGGDGNDGAPLEGSEIYSTCGKGGSSFYGDGASSEMGRLAVNGNDAEHTGAGGSGASCTAGAYDKKGGRGGDGAVYVYRYVKLSGTEA